MSVVNNSQRGSQKRIIEKLRYTLDCKLPAVEEARREEGVRDNLKTVKLEAHGETDRVLMEKGNWRERDRAQMAVRAASVAQVPV